MYWAISSSVFAKPSGPHGEMMNPFQAFAVTKRLTSLMAYIIVCMSKSVDKKLSSIIGGWNRSELLSVTFPPDNQQSGDEGMS